MLLIGISAKAGCGKTTLAEALVNEYGFTRLSIADALKEECAKFTGLGLEYFNVPELKEATVTVPFGRIVPRKFMQIWGTEFRRAQDSNYWIQTLWEKVLVLERQGIKRLVVDDVRFVNEAFFIRHVSGFMVRLEPYAGYVNLVGEHKSETDLDDYDKFDFRFAPAYGHIIEQAFNPLLNGLIAKERSPQMAKKPKFDEAPEIAAMLPMMLEKVAAEVDNLPAGEMPRIKVLLPLGDKLSYWGRICPTTGPWRYLNDYDFVLVVNKFAWETFENTVMQEALIFHELCHIGYRENAKGEITWGGRRHVIEALPEEVRLYGDWYGSLSDMKAAYVSTP